MDAAYIEVPYDIREIFGKGRLLVRATFDGVPYDGQVVKMGTPFYLIGITKKIRSEIGKSFGDEIDVILTEREKEMGGTSMPCLNWSELNHMLEVYIIPVTA